MSVSMHSHTATSASDSIDSTDKATLYNVYNEMVESADKEAAKSIESLLIPSNSTTSPSNQHAQVFDDAVMNIVQDRIKQQEHADKHTHATSHNPDILAFLLQRDNAHLHQNRLSADEVTDNLRLLLVKGIESTSAVLTWIVYELGRQTDLQTRLRQEVDDYFNSKVSSPTNGHHTSLSSLPFLDAVIHEGLRLYAPVPIVRELSQDLTVHANGKEIVLPAHSVVTVIPSLINHVPAVTKASDSVATSTTSSTAKDDDSHGDVSSIGSHSVKEAAEQKKTDDYSVFNPDHLLSSSSSMLSFSMGPRNCIGHSLALAILRSVLVQLVETYEWSLSADSETPRAVLSPTAIRPSCEVRMDFTSLQESVVDAIPSMTIDIKH
jgi:cytochrome P450